jgi:hypothetical protein
MHLAKGATIAELIEMLDHRHASRHPLRSEFMQGPEV